MNGPFSITAHEVQHYISAFKVGCTVRQTPDPAPLLKEIESLKRELAEREESMTVDQRVWVAAMQGASAEMNMTAGTAASFADSMLAEFRKRWPKGEK